MEATTFPEDFMFHKGRVYSRVKVYVAQHLLDANIKHLINYFRSHLSGHNINAINRAEPELRGLQLIIQLQRVSLINKNSVKDLKEPMKIINSACAQCLEAYEYYLVHPHEFSEKLDKPIETHEFPDSITITPKDDQRDIYIKVKHHLAYNLTLIDVKFLIVSFDLNGHQQTTINHSAMPSLAVLDQVERIRAMHKSNVAEIKKELRDVLKRSDLASCLEAYEYKYLS